MQKVFQCQWDSCTLKFISLEKLDSHLETIHILPMKKVNRSNKTDGFPCKWKNCNREHPFKGLYNLTVHVRFNHSHYRPFSCILCDLTFHQMSDLTVHIKRKHPNEMDSFHEKAKKKIKKVKRTICTTHSCLSPISKKPPLSPPYNVKLSNALVQIVNELKINSKLMKPPLNLYSRITIDGNPNDLPFIDPSAFVFSNFLNQKK